MQIKYAFLLLALSYLYGMGCNVEQRYYQIDLQQLDDEEYPDNPHIGYRSATYDNSLFTKGSMEVEDTLVVTMRFGLVGGGSIVVSQVELAQWIPTAPDYATAPYIAELAVVNQEWNRNQVAFRTDQFTSTDTTIVRVDIARNCLNSYLWEVIPYVQESGQLLPVGHAWFDFPHDLYAEQFGYCNAVSFDDYRSSLEHWRDPEHQHIEAVSIRAAGAGSRLHASDLSDTMYPLAGERAKKRKEVIYPPVFETMRDLQSDITTFATFSPPGYYDRRDPRKTELGRLYQLDSVVHRRVLVHGSIDSLDEVQIFFADKSRSRHTIFHLGGLRLSDVPTLPVAQANRAWKSSMGFGNHTFYETYDHHTASSLKKSTYYAYLTDGRRHWLDSHFVGIDGPLLHWDDSDPGKLHLWLLSFERHALVGHYVLDLTTVMDVF